MDYANENEFGRRRVAQVVADCAATGDVPRLVREIRAAVADESGAGVGFLYALAERATAWRV